MIHGCSFKPTDWYISRPIKYYGYTYHSLGSYGSLETKMIWIRPFPSPFMYLCIYIYIPSWSSAAPSIRMPQIIVTFMTIYMVWTARSLCTRSASHKFVIFGHLHSFNHIFVFVNIWKHLYIYKHEWSYIYIYKPANPGLITKAFFYSFRFRCQVQLDYYRDDSRAFTHTSWLINQSFHLRLWSWLQFTWNLWMFRKQYDRDM